MLFIEGGYTFLFAALSVYFIKRIHAVKLHTPAILSLDDLFYCMLFAIFKVLASFLSLTLIYAVLSSCVFLIVWLDAVLLNCYGMKVTISNLGTAQKGISTFKGELQVLVTFLKRLPWIGAALFFAVFSTQLSLSMSYPPLSIAILLALFIFILTKSKLKPFYGLPWLLSVGVLYYIFKYVPFTLPSILYSGLLFILLSTVLFQAFYNRKELSFSKSIFRGLLVGNKIKRYSMVKDNEVIKSFEKIAGKEKSKIANSKHFGKCKSANVLLFTVESLSEEAFNKSAYKKELQETLSCSSNAQKAYSVSPNTNQSLHQLYSSCYGSEKPLVLLDELTKQGYEKTFLTTQETSFFGMNDLLNQAGFDHVFDKKSFADGHNDYAIEDMFFDKIVPKLKRGKSFTHILNNQTHSTYSVVDKEKFNHEDKSKLKSRYLNAVDESLFIINNLLKKLKEQKLLENTIVIITGDHGQSFGEFGYYAHSSSTVKEQVSIPFLLYHSELSDLNIDQIRLLDVLPLCFDLLGLEVDLRNFDGVNALTTQAEYTLLYSDTKSGNSASSVSLLFQGKKYYVDNVFCKRLLLDFNDCIIEDKKINEQVIETLIYTALEKHQLLQA